MKLDQALPPKSVLQDIDIHETFLWMQTLIDGTQGIQRLYNQVQEKTSIHNSQLPDPHKHHLGLQQYFEHQQLNPGAHLIPIFCS